MADPRALSPASCTLRRLLLPPFFCFRPSANAGTLLCQISDPHIVSAGTLAYGRVDTGRMLEHCVNKILALPRLPDAIVATGDLTDHGTVEEYEVLAELPAPLPMPIYLVVGNHDDPDALRSVFPHYTHLTGDNGFVQYAVDDLEVRLVVLDTTVPGEPGGELCARRLQWLDRTLGESDRPTIISRNTIHRSRPGLR